MILPEWIHKWVEQLDDPIVYKADAGSTHDIGDIEPLPQDTFTDFSYQQRFDAINEEIRIRLQGAQR